MAFLVGPRVSKEARYDRYGVHGIGVFLRSGVLFLGAVSRCEMVEKRAVVFSEDMGCPVRVSIDGQEYRLSLHAVPINENIVHFFGIARVWARNWSR